MTPGAQVSGGSCALHPERASQATCTRCGNFMCATCCSGGSESMCPPCRHRTGVGDFPFHRDDFSFDRLWNYSFEQWKKQWVMLAVAVLALGGIYMVGAVIMQLVLGGGLAALGQAGRGSQPDFGAMAGILTVAGIGYVVLLLILGVGFIGLLRMCCDVLLGKPADFAVLFSQFSKMGRALLLLLMMGAIAMIPVVVVFGGIGAVTFASISAMESGSRDAMAGGMVGLIFIGYFVFLVAEIWITLPFTFAMLELAHSDAGAVECLKRGYSLSKGFRLNIFGYRLIGGLISMAGMLACCVGMLPAIALAYMLETALYLAVRNGSGLPPFHEPPTV
jgi:hypothetical protein